MKALQLFTTETPSFDEGSFGPNSKKNGVITSRKSIINIACISSIDRYKGKLLHEGWDCSKITMNNGNTFIDYRKPSELLYILQSDNISGPSAGWYSQNKSGYILEGSDPYVKPVVNCVWYTTSEIIEISESESVYYL
jgi:hypothetical protein